MRTIAFNAVVFYEVRAMFLYIERSSLRSHTFKIGMLGLLVQMQAGLLSYNILWSLAD
jgi:hypothetical protein